MTSLQDDLAVRWLPSHEQMLAADGLLATGRYLDGVFTTHLLIGKRFGVWTADVEVKPLDGVFTDRMACQHYVYAEAKRHYTETGQNVVGGYAWHSRHGHAAVWEDICSQFPREGR